jgi:hypothetical protein
MGNDAPHPQKGREGTVAGIASQSEATCFQAPAGQSCFKENLITGSLTSGYFAGQNRDIRPGKCRSGGFFGRSPDFGGINKDMSACIRIDGAGFFGSRPALYLLASVVTPHAMPVVTPHAMPVVATYKGLLKENVLRGR